MGLHFDAVAVGADGDVLAAASALTGRIWCGTLYALPAASSDALSMSSATASAAVAHGMGDLARVAPDLAAAACDDGAVRLFRLSYGRIDEAAAAAEHDDMALTLAFGGDTLASGGADAAVKLWSFAEGELRSARTLKGACDAVVGLAWDSQSTLFGASRDGAVHVWDARQAACTGRLDAGDAPPTAVAALGDRLIVGHATGAVSLWDRRALSQPNAAILKPHGAAVRRIVDAGGSTFATCGDDGAVVVSDAATGTHIYHDRRHGDFVRGLASDSSGRICSGGWDGRILLHTRGSP